MTMSYDHTSATAKSDQPKANSDLREIPAQLHLMSAAIENAEQQLASLIDDMESALYTTHPSSQSDPRESSTHPAATPLGSSIQFARLRVEQIATRIIDIRTRIGL